jgi:hypothetical protein
VKTEILLVEVLLWIHFPGYYFMNIIKIPSMLRIQILHHISFFKLRSEYLEYILILNKDPTEVSEQ